MKVKFIIQTPSGSLDTIYADTVPSPGGYADMSRMDLQQALAGVLLNHGDTIKVELLDQLEPDERSAEDERQMGLR